MTIVRVSSQRPYDVIPVPLFCHPSSPFFCHPSAQTLVHSIMAVPL
ncbi:hypothetical protein [Wolbachia endosymbiont (group A) of Rhinocyllus conicus]|nr:hypothetical protein [Wolbachia endosymbiont (group A) of Rhinocyllus conicus]